ncbi:MAG: DNA-directed RNA polymerase subunit beta [Armatimonadota bacterium]
MATAEKVVYPRNKREDILPLPNLIEVQTRSYDWFCEEGLRELFEDFSEIEDYTGTISLDFLDYRIGEPTLSITEARERDATYEAPVHAKVRLVNKETGEIKESEVYIGELPQMTDHGTFLINGAERVVISQLARSPSVYFKDNVDNSGRVQYGAQIIPNEGAWVEIEGSAKGRITVKVGQTRKFPVTTLLRALDWFEDLGDGPEPTGTDEQLIDCFGVRESISVKEIVKQYKEIETATMPGAEAHDVYYATSRLTDDEGNVVVEPYSRITQNGARALQKSGAKEVRVLRIPSELDATLEDDETKTSKEGLLDVYRKIRPGDPPTVESAQSLLHSYFFDVKRYDLSAVGRYKMNKKLNLDVPNDIHTLTRADLVAIVQYLIGLARGEGNVDDIDHLQNKRVRAVGELLQNQMRTGFLRTERVARERMTSSDPEEMTPQSVISIKPITAAVNSFFGSGQLSQFMDQINPLAELSHKRRLSALGPGGLSKQSAKLEVRDVHHSHYGRICPIQTPEGPNVGLIGYMTMHARLNEYGFIEAPYCIVKDGKVTSDIVWLTADEEEEYYIASASEPINEKGEFVNERISCRHHGDYPQMSAEEVDLCDVAPGQVFSVATSLIPFLESDEPVRALAGSNMQRQAVPLIRAQRPLVRTGLEGKAAVDSGATALAEDDGRVIEADAKRVVVEYANGEQKEYGLEDHLRTNMGTCVNESPLVRPNERIQKGEPLYDSTATRDAQLALGQNLTVCFLPWEGYNYEDAILISERLVRDDELTSIHIEKYECEARDTKLGPEEITRDIPNVGEDALADLDVDGVIRVGAEVRAEDILVGRVTPKGQSELTAEEKLVIAIFGKKAEEMRDVSLRMPHGETGIVIGTKTFSRYKYQCTVCEAEYAYGKPMEAALTCRRCGGDLKKLPGDELKPGVNQLVRVYVAQKRKIVVGDKLTGRHGNKGVISKILPEEDMPYLPDGRPVDIVLNPLTVPSRMNIGQVLETHLGWLAEKLDQVYITPVFQSFTADEIQDDMKKVQIKMQSESLRSYAGCELNAFGQIIDVSDAPDDFEELQEFLVDQLRDHGKDELQELAEWLAVDPETWDDATPKEAAELIVNCAVENSKRQVQFDAETGRSILYDGRTGEPFNQPVMVGNMYILKLLHLADDKIHARSTGPYSLITQQPLGGKAQMGGQRFGEMEVWALEAYGAANMLQEMLTIKSDDVTGRVAAYEAIVKNENIEEPGIPESFKILVREMQSLALDVKVKDESGREVDLTGDLDYR